MLFIFCPPFFWKAVFLFGTHAPSPFPPFIFLTLFYLLYDDKTRTLSFILLGILTGIGLYFTYEYFLFLFFCLCFVLIRKNSSKKGILIFVATFLIFIIPFCIYSLVSKEGFFVYRGGDERNAAWLITRLSTYNPLILIERLKFIIMRYFETFLYQQPVFFGISNFLIFLISFFFSFRRKVNKAILAGLIFFILLNLGRLISRFDISSPCSYLPWGGSSRYFVFGFELVLVFIAYFLSRVRKTTVGKAVSYIILFSFVFSFSSFMILNSDAAFFKRKFPLGYNYEDLGGKFFFWNQRDFRKALLSIREK